MKESFCSWLSKQTDRDDPIGDLARDVRDDSSRPHGNSGYRKWFGHIRIRSYSNSLVMDAFRKAWREYEDSLH